jgi:hypothetical protein
MNRRDFIRRTALGTLFVATVGTHELTKTVANDVARLLSPDVPFDAEFLNKFTREVLIPKLRDYLYNHRVPLHNLLGEKVERGNETRIQTARHRPYW